LLGELVDAKRTFALPVEFEAAGGAGKNEFGGFGDFADSLTKEVGDEEAAFGVEVGIAGVLDDEGGVDVAGLIAALPSAFDDGAALNGVAVDVGIEQGGDAADGDDAGGVGRRDDFGHDTGVLAAGGNAGGNGDSELDGAPGVRREGERGGFV